MTAPRRQAERRGRAGEQFAEFWLALKGYRILERRLRTPVGEIDLVARRGALVCFVEVKTRSTQAAALEAVSVRARQRIERAASAWLAQNDPESLFNVRFDVVAIAPFRFPLHIRQAWRPDFAAGGR